MNEIESKFDKLDDLGKQEVLDYIDFLLFKKNRLNNIELGKLYKVPDEEVTEEMREQVAEVKALDSSDFLDFR